MSWRLAKSLEQLRSEANDRWPARSKASDGTVGDLSHQASASDHNPNVQGVVCAFDLTHDPDNGVDCFVLSEFIRNHRPPALKYIIFNGRICSARGEWVWRPNTGHEHHMHVSVGVGPDGHSTGPYDDLTPWLEHFDTPGDELTMDKEAQAAFEATRTDIASTKRDVETVAKKVDQAIERLDALLKRP